MISYNEILPEAGFVIAETACGHEGDVDKLKQLIDVAAESTAQIVKFQIFKIKERATKGQKEWKIFNKLTLNNEEWEEGVKYAREKNLTIFADVYGEESLLLAEKLNVDGYKIHSEDLLNSYFVLKVVKHNKITIIGVGGAKRIEINNLLEFLQNNDALNNVILMTGIQTFPTPVEAHSIGEVGDLIKKYSRYGIKVGFSDHVSGYKDESYSIPLMAYSMGACIIEKHITVNRNDKWIDYHSALGKDDFKRFMGQVHSLCPLLKPIGLMNEHEYKYRRMFKKSPAAAIDLKADKVLEPLDIKFCKDSDNAIPISSFSLIGKTLKRNIKTGKLYRLNNLKNKVGGIIVARCTSSRMPNKALRKIDGRESIALVIDRIKRCNNIDCIILATSTHESDNKLIDIAEREGISTYRGSLNNVALRFYEAANKYNLDHFIRITGDAILCDEEMIDKAIKSHLNQCCDVTLMKNMPFGTHKEIVSINAIRTIISTVPVPANTEYLEYYLENDRYFNINYVESDYVFDSRLRMTLDYEEDLIFFEKIFKRFNNLKQDFTLRNILEWLSVNLNIIEINAHKKQKTPINQGLDVSLKI